ncbi:MAG: hypothetical protein E7578_09065 [Ruminococcaceae bacterium]|nr:hypothetical protein [Oscillospiraceae bacterium]
MKNSLKTRLLALLMTLVMLFSLAACGGSDSDSGSNKNNDEPKKEKTEAADSEESADSEEVTDIETKAETETNIDDTNKFEDVNSIDHDDLSYVMIYNPKIYNENLRFDSSSLSTGYLGSQVSIDFNRGDGLDEEKTPEYGFISQDSLNEDVPWDKINLDGNRGEGIGFDYDEGDEREFFIYDTSMRNRYKEEFECIYAGEYCYIWTDGSGDEDALTDYGEEFDSNIYEEMVDTFGMPRFVSDDGGKVNLLFYPLQSNLLGFFTALDIFAEGEYTENEIESYGMNTGHAIVNINSRFLDYTDVVCGTMAHEFQHLICMSAAFDTVTGVYSDTWFNEGMSGYIEEKLYSGVKAMNGHFDSLNDSSRIRKGQSLYNFENDGYDIGVYGSVYYFSEFLVEIAGSDVFSDFYKYWRQSYSDTLCTAEGIYNAIPDSTRDSINNSIAYSSNVSFENDYEKFMSKLTFNYYLSVLSGANIKGFDNIEPEDLLYDSIDGTNIEGGGRIIVAVDGEFEIPKDAEAGLVYVGLDNKFRPISDLEFICK